MAQVQKEHYSHISMLFAEQQLISCGSDVIGTNGMESLEMDIKVFN